jgi:hypothetical protein
MRRTGPALQGSERGERATGNASAHLRKRKRAAAHEQPPLCLQPLQRRFGGRQDGVPPRRCRRSQA